MTTTERQELYDFALVIYSRHDQNKNPLEEFCGVINDEDAAIMMNEVDE